MLLRSSLTLSLILVLALSFTAPAQQTQESDYSKAIFEKHAAAVENDIASDLERVRDLPAAAQPALNARIDLRLLERWMALAAAHAPQDDPLQIAASIRIVDLQSLAADLGQRLDAVPQLSATQLEGMKQLHAMTFALPALKNVGEMDAACRKVAMNLILAGGPSPADTKDLPSMRPPGVTDDSDNTAKSPSVSDLSARAQALAVSPALRRELMALLSASTAPDLKPAEQALLQQSLGRALDLAEGIAQMAALDPMSPAPFEEQITQSLALLNDVRTRDAGAARLAALGDYRRTFDRIAALNVPPQLRDRLAPALLWARQNAQKGSAVLELIRDYLDLCSAADGFHETSAASAQHKAIESMQKTLAARREAFLADAGGLEAKGMLEARLTSLRGHVDRMRQALDTMRAIDGINKSIQTLDSFKPRPRGMLERRSVAALGDLGSSVSTERREQAIRFVLDVDRLARAAESFEGATAGIAPATLSQYMGDHADAVESRRNALIMDLATQLGAGKQLEKTQVSRLESLSAVMKSLRDAARIESVVEQQDLLARWVDWTINSQRLGAILAPYRQAARDAIEGFANDNAAALAAWPQIQLRYEPLIRQVLHVSEHAAACAKLPEGYFADCAKLMTPLDAQPFAEKRRLSFIVCLWNQASASGDMQEADAVLDSLRRK